MKEDAAVWLTGVIAKSMSWNRDKDPRYIAWDIVEALDDAGFVIVPKTPDSEALRKLICRVWNEQDLTNDK